MVRRAFTMVEMLAVIVVLATLSLIMAPNLASSVKANAVRTYFASVDRLPAVARQRAMSTGVIVTLRADESGRLALQTDRGTGEEPEESDSVNPPAMVAIDGFITPTGEASAAEWQVRFYPDGTSDRGALQFVADGAPWYLVVDDQGNGRVQQGEAPEITEDRWEAGDRVQRS